MNIEIRDMLVQTFKDVGINIVAEAAQAQSVIASKSKSLQNLRNIESGNIYGCVYKDTIYIDPEIATIETALHEYTHLWTETMRQCNPEEWDNIVFLLKEEKELWEKTKADYPELDTDDAIADEVLAQYSGQRGSERMLKEAEFYNAPSNILTVITESLEKLWNFVADFLHIHYESKEQVADQILKDALSGVNPLQYQSSTIRNDSEIELAYNMKFFLANSESYMHLPNDLQKIYNQYESLAEEYMAAATSPLIAPTDKEEIKESFISARRRYGEAMNAYFGVSDFSVREQVYQRYIELCNKFTTNKAIYTALFVEDKESLLKNLPPVHSKVFGDHLTTSFRPESVNTLELGDRTELHIKGRLTSDKVDILLLNESFVDLYASGMLNSINGRKGVKGNDDITHITLSTAEGVSPKESNDAIRDFLELSEMKWRYESSILPSEKTLAIYDIELEAINKKLSAYIYTPMDYKVKVRNGAFIEGGNIIFSPEENENIRFQKTITTINKVSWQGTMNAYSSSMYIPIRALSQAVKQGNPEAIEEASNILTKLVERIPDYKNAVLIPIPNRSGHAEYTLDLAKSISQKLNLPVVDVLTGSPHKALYHRKRNTGNDGLKLMRFDTKNEIPIGKSFILVDNVLDTGTTAMSAMKTLGDSTSLVVLGNTNNSQKYNYPIDIHVAPVVTDHFTKSRIESIHKIMIDYYMDKYNRQGVGVNFKDLIRVDELQDWQGVANTAKKMEVVLYSNTQFDKEDKNRRINNESLEALSYILKADSFNRLAKDMRTVIRDMGIAPETEGWKLDIKDSSRNRLTISIPADKKQLPLIISNKETLDLASLPNSEYNHIVSQLVNKANITALAVYLNHHRKTEEIGKLKDVVPISMFSGEKARAYAFRLSVSNNNTATLSFGNYLSDVISGKTYSFENIKEADKKRILDAVMLALGAVGEKKIHLENYVIENNKYFEETGLKINAEHPQNINSHNVNHLNNSAMTENVANNEERQNVASQEVTAQEEQNTQNSRPKDRWANIDYSKYQFPENVDVKDANVYKTSIYDQEKKKNVNRYKVIATINGQRRSSTLMYNDANAFFERDTQGNLTKRVSAHTLAAKYFAKDYIQNQAEKQSHLQEPLSKEAQQPHGEQQNLKSLGEFEIPIYSIGYLMNGSDNFDGLDEEDVHGVTNFKQSLPANYVIQWPEDINEAKYYADQPSFGKASEVVRVKIFQVQETAVQNLMETSQAAEEQQQKQKFTSVCILKDGEGKLAIYAKPGNDKPFTVYATPEDVELYYAAFNDKSVNKKEVHSELAKKYYEMYKTDPSAETTVFKSNATSEDLARISSANVFRTKVKIFDGEKHPSKTLMTAVIDGTKQEAREISEEQMLNTFLAPDAKDYKTHLAFKVFADILHPELKEKKAEPAKEEPIQEQASKEEINISTQANLLTHALEAATVKNGVWMNESRKDAPTLLSSKAPISAFNSMIMALNSDQNGYKTNVYTSFATAKNEGFSVRSGQLSLPFNWFEWDRFANKFNPSDIIDKKTYEALPVEEKEMYKPTVHKEVQKVFNIDQTLMKQQKTELYKEYVSGQGNKEEKFRQLMADVKESVAGFTTDVIKFESVDADTELYIDMETEKGEKFFAKFEKGPFSVQYYEVGYLGVGSVELTSAEWKEKITASIASLKEAHPEANLHPALRQYQDLKTREPGVMILFRTDDVYEIYKEDAQQASHILGLSLTQDSTIKDKDGNAVPIVSFPRSELDFRLPQLIKSGARVALYDNLKGSQIQNYGAEAVVYNKLDQITSELLNIGAETTRVEPSHFKDDTLTIDISRRSEPGKEMETALERANALYRSLAAYTFTEDKLNIGAKSRMLPEDTEKYTKLIQELSAGVLMANQGYPARLSSEGCELVPFWNRELCEVPTIIDKIENDVNNVVKVVNKIVKGQGLEIDYERMRGDKATPMLAQDYTIVSEVNRHPSLDEKHMVLIKDDKNKSVDVILPEGASLKMGEDIKGMNKNRIAIALTKEGYDGLKISWYNAQGDLALKQPNDYFEGKHIEVARLKQYTLIPISVIDVSGELKRNDQIQFEKVQMLRDDEGHWALYVAPQKEQGEAFAIYPEPMDIKHFFETLKTGQASAVAQELGLKYFLIAEQHPELKATFMMPEISDEQLLSRITKVDITQNKNKEKSIVMWATIDGKIQPPKELTQEQYQRFFLVNDQEAYKRALASKLYSDKLLINTSETTKQEEHHEHSEQLKPTDAQKSGIEESQNSQESQEETSSRSFHI